MKSKPLVWIVGFLLVAVALTSVFAGLISPSLYNSNFNADKNTTTTNIIGTIGSTLTLSSVNWTEQNQTTGNASGIITFNLNNTGNNSLVQPFCLSYSFNQVQANNSCGIVGGTIATPLLNAGTTSNGCSGSQNYSSCYEELIRSHYASGNVTRIISNKLIIPWMSSSTSCTQADLHASGTFTNGYPMVTDEFSQIGLLLSLGMNQTKFIQFKNTVNVINSSRAQLPGWQVFINESTSNIDACKSGYNGNCDTASDANARIVIALYGASNNTAFTNTSDNANSYALASNISANMVTYEVVNQCYNSTLGNGNICWWLAAGSVSKNNGLGSTDFGYSGYYGDATIAMLAACAETGNQTYCAIAGNFTLNYLQASKFNGTTFTVPPGRSFAWNNITAGNTTPVASCTNTCSPDQWDAADAPRAVSMCMAQQYANAVGMTLPNMTTYCSLWEQRYMRQLNSWPFQYYSNGTASASNQSGYLAQGWQAQALMGANTSNYETVMRNCLNHYSSGTGTYDSTTCDGVYNEAFCERALGTGIGRDLGAFPSQSLVCSVPAGVSYTNGGQSVTLNTPANNTNVSGSYTLLNWTVFNNNVTSSTSPGTIPVMIANMTFCSDPATTYNFTLGAGWAWDSAHCGIVYNGSSFQGDLVSGILNLSTICQNGCNITQVFNTTNVTNFKDYLITQAGSNNNFDMNRERNTDTTQHYKRDGGSFSQTANYNDAGNVTVTSSINISQNATMSCAGGSCTANETAAITNLAAADYIRWHSGTISPSNTGTQIELFQIQVWNIGTPYNVTGAPANSTLNVTVSNSTTQLFQQNGTANGTTQVFNVTNLVNGQYAWRVNMKSQTGEERNFSFSFNVSQPNVINTTNYCTLTGNITLVNVLNNTPLNISILNITDGTSYWTPDLTNYILNNLGTTTSNKTLMLSTYPQGQNNTYTSIFFAKNLTANFTPTITYAAGSNQNNTAVDISCDGINYISNVTTGQLVTCTNIARVISYRVTLYRNNTASPTINTLNITMNESLCGNGVIDGGETCDNSSSNGACPAVCSLSCSINSCSSGGGGGGGGGMIASTIVYQNVTLPAGNATIQNPDFIKWVTTNVPMVLILVILFVVIVAIVLWVID